MSYIYQMQQRVLDLFYEKLRCSENNGMISHTLHENILYGGDKGMISQMFHDNRLSSENNGRLQMAWMYQETLRRAAGCGSGCGLEVQKGGRGLFLGYTEKGYM